MYLNFVAHIYSREEQKHIMCRYEKGEKYNETRFDAELYLWTVNFFLGCCAKGELQAGVGYNQHAQKRR